MPAMEPKVIHRWGVTPGEEAQTYRSDEVMPEAPSRWLHAVSVQAPAAAVFQRVCQLRAAPYSYDWIDNRGRRSPREVLPWCAELAAGQEIMTIFTLESFVLDVEVTMRTTPCRYETLFGACTITYRVVPQDSGGCRLISVVRAEDGRGPAVGLRRWLMCWCDTVMMRKQLRTLAALARKDAHAAEAAS